MAASKKNKTTVIKVCMGEKCKEQHADRLYRSLKAAAKKQDEKSGIKVKKAECLGCCKAAPVICCGKKKQGRCTLSAQEAADFVEGVRRKKQA